MSHKSLHLRGSRQKRWSQAFRQLNFILGAQWVPPHIASFCTAFVLNSGEGVAFQRDCTRTQEEWILRGGEVGGGSPCLCYLKSCSGR